MKKLISIISIITALLCFACVAQAKVKYNDNVMAEIHINIIKGLLYDISHPEAASSEDEKKKAQRLLPGFSKAIVWLEKCHKDTIVYKLEKINNEEAKVIKYSIAVINDVVNGKYPGIPIQKTMVRWDGLGSRIIVEYYINTSTGSQKTWKFELRSERAKTQNLVFRHEAKVLKIENK